MKENLVNSLTQNVKLIVAAGMKTFAEGLDIESISGVKELQCVKEFYTLPAGDPKEAELKKAISTAAIIAIDKGIPVPGLTGKNPTEIASIVDSALTHSKTLYLIGEGKIDSYEMVSHLVDKAAARLVPVFDNLIDKYAVPATTAVVNAVSVVFPPARLLLPHVNRIAPYLGQKVKEVVHKALPVAKKVAKDVISTVVNKATRVVVKTAKKVKNFLGKLLS